MKRLHKLPQKLTKQTTLQMRTSKTLRLSQKTPRITVTKFGRQTTTKRKKMLVKPMNTRLTIRTPHSHTYVRVHHHSNRVGTVKTRKQLKLQKRGLKNITKKLLRTVQQTTLRKKEQLIKHVKRNHHRKLLHTLLQHLHPRPLINRRVYRRKNQSTTKKIVHR